MHNRHLRRLVQLNGPCSLAPKCSKSGDKSQEAEEIRYKVGARILWILHIHLTGLAQQLDMLN